MRQELKAGNRLIFSVALQQALAEVLGRGQQAILFLNRRGTATYVFCRDCGYTLKCPRCDIPLTYHSAGGVMRCHYCGYERQFPAKCPSCGSQRIRTYGTGTQRVEAEVQAQFPQARTLRWDYETTRKKGAHEIILSHFIAHRADVLVGTQMLAKGLDLPLVTLVGVVLADVGLSLPDYRAAERTFQVLTQVAGRAGRSPLGGQVILQTFQPEHYVIQAAAKHDFKAFFQQELAYRKKLSYPPFNRLVRLEYRHTDPEQAEQAAQELAGLVRLWLEQEERRATRLIGPAPCFFQRIGGLYRWQLILCGPQPVSLLRGRPLGEWRVEVDPQGLL
jgi:primosomal protein N' (replication factor Y)